MSTGRDTFQVTHWGHPHEEIRTCHGILQYRHWLETEVRRWADKNFRDGWVCENSEGLVAMFCWRDELGAGADVEGEE